MAEKMSVEKHAARLAAVYTRAKAACESSLPHSVWPETLNHNEKAAHEIATLLVQAALSEAIQEEWIKPEPATVAPRDYYARGRRDVYGELIENCIEHGRRSTAVWLVDQLAADMRLQLDLRTEQVVWLDGLDRRARAMKVDP